MKQVKFLKLSCAICMSLFVTFSVTAANTWQEIETSKTFSVRHELPLPRAGIATFAYQDSFIVVGGESANPNKAHEEVHLFNSQSKEWLKKPPLKQGRHGSGVIEINGYLWIASGSGMQGGSPELNSVERIKLDKMFISGIKKGK